MKILEIIPNLDSGGAERFVVDLSNEFSKTNEVVLVLFYPVKSSGGFYSEVNANIKLITLDKKRGFDFFLLIKLYKLIKQEKPDIIHTHIRAFSYLALLKIFFLKTKIFHTIHNDAYKEAGGRILYLLKKYFFRRGKIIPVVISDDGEKSFKQYYRMSAPLIYNGRTRRELKISDAVIEEMQNYKITPHTKILINVARIQRQKNQIMLCECLSELAKEGFDMRLLIIGNKTNQQIVQSIEALNCKNIFLLGEKNNPMEYMAMADAFCLSSSWEGMPISLIEAFFTATIPVCTPAGGVKDMIKDGVNGILSTDLSKESYKNAIIRYLNMSTDEINKMKTEILETSNQYSMEECAESYIKLMAE
jgi:glycosyltransferase involved in cell wall biosynthesis